MAVLTPKTKRASRGIQELQAWFQGSVFEKNGYGVTFDPDKLLGRWENGDPIEELVQQGSA